MKESGLGSNGLVWVTHGEEVQPEQLAANRGNLIELL
jgi:hypothetical protein